MAEAKKVTKPKKTSTKTTAKDKIKAAVTTAAKKASKAPKSKDPNFKPLSKKEIESFRQALLHQRTQLIGDVDQMGISALKDNRQESSGDLSSMPIHMADIGTDNYEQEFTLGLIESERNMLKDIDLALSKIVDGVFGICEATDKPIGRTRLQAKPYARYTIDYARKLEKGLVPDINSTNPGHNAQG